MPARRNSATLKIQILMAIADGNKTRASIVAAVKINSVIFNKYIAELERNRLVIKIENGTYELSEKGKNIIIKLEQISEISQAINFIEKEITSLMETNHTETPLTFNGTVQRIK
jgi:predicted transcriptional regulator